MLNDTLKAIKATEAEADELVQKNVQDCDSVVQKAKDEAATLLKTVREKADEEALKKMQDVEAECDEQKRTALLQVDEHIEQLRSNAEKEESKAIKAIIEALQN